MKPCSPVTGPALYGLVLLTVSDPQEMIPFNPVVDRLGAESVPSTEAPLVTDWGSAGTSAVRERMLFATATAAAVAITTAKAVCCYRDGGRCCGSAASDVSSVNERMI